MKKLFETLHDQLIERIAGQEIDESFQYGLSYGQGQATNKTLSDILELLENNDDIKVIADGHRVNKTKTAQATADGLEIGYQYAIGLIRAHKNRATEI